MKAAAALALCGFFAYLNSEEAAFVEALVDHMVKSFDKIAMGQREEFLLNLQAGKVTFENGPPARVFFTTLYQNVEKFRDKKYSVDPTGIADVS